MVAPKALTAMPPTEISGRRILVTGGAGFIGSEVVRQLAASPGNEVVVVDDFSLGLEENMERQRNVHVYRMDIRSAGLLRLVQESDIVLHLAARTYIPHSYTHPAEYFDANASGTMHLLSCILDSDVRRLVYVSTSEVYGTARYVPIDEEHPTFPQSTYAVSKLASERLAFTMHKEHGFAAVILRPFNTYGPRDSHPRIIPEAIMQLRRGGMLRLGNLDSSRDFSFVTDTAAGILRAAASSRVVGETINLGSGVETTVREVVEQVARLLGRKRYRTFVEKKRLRPFDVVRLVADMRKAKKLLGWEPQVGLAEGLRRTVDWYRKAGRWRWEREDYPGK